MKVVPTVVTAQHRHERGATAVEYGLILAGVVAVIIGVVQALGGEVVTLFNTVIGTF